MRFRPPAEMYHPEHFFWLSAITRVAVIVLLVVGVIVLVRYLSDRYPPGSFRAAPRVPSQQSSAMQILEERFARGEIDEDEFRSRKEALRS